MYNVSQDYLDFINDANNIGRNSKNKVVIDNTEYFSDTLKTNPKISHKATSLIGGFPAKSCNFEILNLDGSLSLNNKEIEVYKGLEINGSVEWVKMGIFHAKDEDITTDQTTKSISFSGTDRATNLDDGYVSSLDWSTSHTGLEIVQEICTAKGITLETTAFNFATHVFTEKPNFTEDITNREVISRLAEIGGEIAFISRNGGLRIAGQNTTNQTVSKSKREKITREKEFKINTVVLGKDGIDDDIVYPETIAGDRIEWRIEDNPYVDLIREDIIQEVASHIIGISVIPFSLSGFIDDYIYDLNDVISVTDNNGDTFNAVMLEYETQSRIKSNIAASTEKTDTTTNYNIAGSTKQTINKVQLQVNHNTQEITSLATKTENVESKVSDLENSIDYFSVDLSQYALIIPTDSNKKPLETKQYVVNFFGYYKGEQITPTVNVNGSYGGITVTKDSTSIKFSVNANTAITNELNEYTVSFKNGTDTITKKIEVSLAVAGAKGADGTSGSSSYTHIKYSANADGTDFTNNPTTTTKYMGIAITNSSTAPTAKTSYTWSEIKGEDGTNGQNGQDGQDGITYYTWIKYADTPTSGMSDTPTGKKYMGIAYNKTTATESTNYGDYAWSLIKGTDGSKGQDGVSSYIHVRYSANSDGNPMTTSPDDNTQYLGTATTTSSTAPTSYSAYTWVKIKGEQGIPGTPGTSTYFYVRYSVNSNGNPMTTNPSTSSKYMGVASTTSATAPTSYTAYTWTLIKGADGEKGDQGNPGTPGAKGEDGKSSYLHIKYSDDGTTFTANEGETPGRWRGELVDFVEEDSTTFSDYTWYDMGLIVDDELDAIRSEIVTNTTQINQTTEQIVLNALEEYVKTTDYETFKQTVQTSITQTHEDITFSFDTLSKTISNMDTDVQEQFQEISKYIRFNDGGISLGEVNNDITLRIENDIIYFSVAGVSVMNITPNGIEIDSAKFNNRAEIGSFAFVNEDDGSFSLVKI